MDHATQIMQLEVQSELIRIQITELQRLERAMRELIEALSVGQPSRSR